MMSLSDRFIESGFLLGLGIILVACGVASFLGFWGYWK